MRDFEFVISGRKVREGHKGASKEGVKGGGGEEEKGVGGERGGGGGGGGGGGAPLQIGVLAFSGLGQNQIYNLVFRH